MNESTLDTVREQAQALQAQRVTIVRRIEKANDLLADVDRKLNAISTVFTDILGEDMPTGAPDSNAQNGSRARQRPGSVTGAVRAALRRVGYGRFNVEGLMELMDSEAKIDSRQVAKTITRLIREGDGSIELNGAVVSVQTHGAGSKSAVYRKVGAGEDDPAQNTTQGGVGSELDIPPYRYSGSVETP